MNLVQTANAIYKAICKDVSAQAQIRREFSSLAVSIATDPDATAQITSATVNGQTFSATSTMTNGQRLELLRLVVSCLDRRTTISTTLISTF